MENKERADTKIPKDVIRKSNVRWKLVMGPRRRLKLNETPEYTPKEAIIRQERKVNQRQDFGRTRRRRIYHFII